MVTKSKRLTYKLSGGLSPAQIRAVKRQILMVLEKIGVEIDHDGILRYLASHSGVTTSGRRVCFSPALVEEYLVQIRRENADYCFLREGETEWTIRPAYLCLNCYDALSGKVTRARYEDLVRAVKLCDAFGFAGAPPVHPQDVPEALKQVATARGSSSTRG